jgi:osmotically-inducible protein OsmY
MTVAAALGLGGCAGYAAWHKCGPAGCPGDAQLAAAVRARLDQHRELQAPNVLYVQALDGVVYLTGEVGTDLQRDIAATVAGEVPGARRVVNDVALEYPGR